MSELEKQALELPEKQRAALALHLLRSLPPVLHDEDGGIAEALQRDADFEANPEKSISIDLEDRRELAAAKKRNAGKPGTPLHQAAKELGL